VSGQSTRAQTGAIDTATEARRGRPRSQRSTAAILQAAGELLERDGFGSLTVEAVAARAGVGKATIYRWWPNKAALAMDAFLAEVGPTIRFRDTGSAREDFRRQMRALSRVYAHRRTGHTLAGLIAAAQSDEDVATALRVRYLESRRAEGRAAIERAKERGDLKADVDPELVMDGLYGPIYFRLLTGVGKLNERFIDALVAQAFDGLDPVKARPRLPGH
jgi:AcrR family transcriptional regulator